MATKKNPLNYRASRSTTQNALLSMVLIFVMLFLGGFIPTEWFADKYNYDVNLEGELFRTSFFTLYAPWQWVKWGWRLANFPAMHDSVQIMFIIGTVTAIVSMISGIVASHYLNKADEGMDGLHGTAAFAEKKDVENTGFINTRGNKKKNGVVVGSILYDRKGEVIHPHHNQFKNRYLPMYEKLTVGTVGDNIKNIFEYRRNPFSPNPLRDKNGMPRYRINTKVVKKVEVMRDDKNTHIFAFCPTRSGKGVGMVVPTLLRWVESVFVNDPKGEAYALTSGYRKACGHKIIKFEPACEDGSGARWNPLDEIRAFTDRDVADTQMIITMACDPNGEGLEEYFDKAGAEFLAGAALHVRYTVKNGSLADLANFLGDPEWESDEQMYREMAKTIHDPDWKMGWKNAAGEPTQTHPMIANAAGTMLKKESKDRSGVLSTAKTVLSLYLDPIVAKNTGCSDFLVRDLMTSKKPVSLYYVVAPSDMSRIVPLTRLFYEVFIRRNASEMKFKDGEFVKSYEHPLLMIIDEAISLKKLPILQEALSYVAGYGIRMFILVQDIAQVEEVYGQNQSFDSGAETRIAYAPNKLETSEKLARMTGKATVTEQSVSFSRDLVGVKSGSASVSVTKTARDLMTADELLKMHDQDHLVFIKGQPPIYGRKAFFYEDDELSRRVKFPPPPKSDVLRIAAGIESKLTSDKDEPQVEDKWAPSRKVMEDKVIKKVAPIVAKMKLDNWTSTEAGAATSKTRSRYKAAAPAALTDDDMAEIKSIVSNTILRQQVTGRLDAF